MTKRPKTKWGWQEWFGLVCTLGALALYPKALLLVILVGGLMAFLFR